MEQVNSSQRRESESLTGNKIFLGSSRLPQKLDSIPEFFSGLLKLAVELDPKVDVLITANGTACDKFVVRIGELFGIPVIRLTGEGCAVDAMLAGMADQMTVLSMRKNGNLHSAVLNRISNGKPTRVLIEPSLTKPALTDELLSAGATGWYLLRDVAEVQATRPENAPPTLGVSDIESAEYLLHWTRRRVGPWPDQTDQEFIDDLLFGVPRKDHRNVAALRRILATGRILASNDITRDPRPVVCFSNITFEQLLERRVFRPHLSRWDFEPFGIGIKKSWLKKKGARAVKYGDESLWESLSDSDKPFFQLNASDSKVDWSVEEEWRVVADVELGRVPANAAIVFVATAADAAEIGEFSRWPIVTLDETLSKKVRNESAN
jgi:hypothetical protein